MDSVYFSDAFIIFIAVTKDLKILPYASIADQCHLDFSNNVFHDPIFREKITFFVTIFFTNEVLPAIILMIILLEDDNQQ